MHVMVFLGQIIAQRHGKENRDGDSYYIYQCWISVNQQKENIAVLFVIKSLYYSFDNLGLSVVSKGIA